MRVRNKNNSGEIITKDVYLHDKKRRIKLFSENQKLYQRFRDTLNLWTRKKRKLWKQDNVETVRIIKHMNNSLVKMMPRAKRFEPRLKLRIWRKKLLMKMGAPLFANLNY